MAEFVRHDRIEAAWFLPVFRIARLIEIMDRGGGLLDAFGLDRAYRRASGCSTFVREAHVVLARPLRVAPDLPVAITSWLLDADAKRLHIVNRMTRLDDDAVLVSYELILFHVDLGARRSAPMPAPLVDGAAALAARHRDEVPPALIGRRLAPAR